ncbi:MAG: CBS domain-containing protein, partial [Acidimicrobiales bacterium]
GGLMNLELVTCPPDAPISEAFRRLRAAENAEPQARTAVHVVDSAGQLVGVASVTALLVADPDSLVSDVMDIDPVRVGPQADVVDIALLMADYDLLTVPVVDRGDEVLGIVTVDDVLEAIIPEDWRRREPQPRPTPSSEESQPGPAANAPPG